ncbi:hypothetical protein KAR91_03105 [Candidatus Pacearchaeota archaeon]|nr:hypothetical protein [Candidatus Pacearchaeota archaeon]
MINNMLLAAILAYIPMRIMSFSEIIYSLYKELHTNEVRILWTILGNLIMVFDALVAWTAYKIIIAVING